VLTGNNGASLFRNGPRFVKSITTAKDKPPRLCIEGLGITFDTPILNKYGETIIFGPNSFDEYFKSSTRPPFWQSHDAATAFGANTELCLLSEGVAFRLDLTNVTNAAKIEELVMSGHDGISIGFTELKTRNEVLFGHPVKMIDEAEIREISLVPRGACKQAFCRLIDANKEPPLHESVNSTMFGIEYDLHNIKIIKEDNDIAICWLERKLSALQAAAEYDEPHLVAPSMTVDQCNRIVSGRYDQLRTEQRALLFS
jgi:HK97 family phage prohead protease